MAGYHGEILVGAMIMAAGTISESVIGNGQQDMSMVLIHISLFILDFSVGRRVDLRVFRARESYDFSIPVLNII